MRMNNLLNKETVLKKAVSYAQGLHVDDMHQISGLKDWRLDLVFLSKLSPEKKKQ